MEFLKIWKIALRRKWIIIATFLSFFVTIVIMTHLSTPSYKASAKLLIETSDTLSSLMSTLGFQSMGGGMIASSTDDEYDTDIALSTIKPLIGELISSLGLKDKKGRLLDAERLTRVGLLNKIILLHPYIKVSQYENADMLEITSFSTNPSEAANISNKLADLFINDKLERTRSEYKAARIFIEQQLQKVRQEYSSSLSLIKDFKIKKKSFDMDLETQNLINKIATLRSNYEDNEKAILEVEKGMMEINQELTKARKYRKETETFSQSEQIKSLKTKLNELLISVGEKSVDFTKEHPTYKQLEKEIDTVKRLIDDEAKFFISSKVYKVDPVYETLYKGLTESYINKEIYVAKRKLLLKYINEYKKELFRMPQKYVENSKLELALSVNKSMYESLLGYLTKVGIAEAMTFSNTRLVESADVPLKPNFPKKPLHYLLGVFLGLFWGFALAFFVEYIDNTVKSSEDIKKFEDLTLLGTIPKTKYLKTTSIISELDPTSPIVEAFRTVKNSIQYASVDKPIKTMAVTSSVGSEGKTSVSVSLAATLSMEGKKVILVDLDLRKPNVHTYFKVRNTVGITDVLTGGMKLEEAIVPSNVKNLDILPSGPIPPDPSRLIESQKLKDIISALKEAYTVVIIDTPPILAVNDPLIIGRITDGILYVIKYGGATFSMIEHAKELMSKAGINIVGAILNQFKTHSMGYYHNYYYSRD